MSHVEKSNKSKTEVDEKSNKSKTVFHYLNKQFSEIWTQFADCGRKESIHAFQTKQGTEVRTTFNLDFTVLKVCYGKEVLQFSLKVGSQGKVATFVEVVDEETCRSSDENDGTLTQELKESFEGALFPTMKKEGFWPFHKSTDIGHNRPMLRTELGSTVDVEHDGEGCLVVKLCPVDQDQVTVHFSLDVSGGITFHTPLSIDDDLVEVSDDGEHGQDYSESTDESGLERRSRLDQSAKKSDDSGVFSDDSGLDQSAKGSDDSAVSGDDSGLDHSAKGSDDSGVFSGDDS
jgi:hypothetical protein